MKLSIRALVLCAWVCLALGAPQPPEVNPEEAPDRCEGVEFDAITPDEKGNYFFFKGTHLWKGFSGPAQKKNEAFSHLDDVHVDAAFRMHNEGDLKSHDHIFFFQGGKVFSYYNHTLEEGYPKEIQQEFPEVPSHLDAAVECPKGECMTDSVLFFKGDQVYMYDISTKTVKIKSWPQLPACTSALRWLEHYYCFHGHEFTRFQPVTGEVTGPYPKDARRYFMRCSNHTHGSGYKPPKCSEVKLDAITTDDSGKTYFFAGPIFMRLDTVRDGLHSFPINNKWKEPSTVDAVFSYTDKMYFIKNNQVYIYKAQDILIDGYPKPLISELGIDGDVDAAFLCDNEHTAHIIQGRNLHVVDLTTTPRMVTTQSPMPLSGIDAALCGADGIKLFKGSEYFRYENVAIMMTSKMAPRPHKIDSAMMGCLD